MSSTGIIAFLSSLWLLFIPALSQAHSLGTPIPAIKEQPLQSPAQLLDTTKKQLTRLLIGNPSQDNASSWEQIAGQFGTLFKDHQETDLGPESLYLQARTYQLMSVRFNKDAYSQQARKKFLQLAGQYPQHRRSDDARYQAALLAPKENPPSSPKELTRQSIVQAEQRQQQIGPKKQYDQSAKTQKMGMANAPAKPPQHVPLETGKSKNLNKLAQISKASYWSSRNYSRVVISAESKLNYQVNQNDEGIIFQLTPCSVAPDVQQLQKFSKGLLHQVQIQDNEEGEVELFLQLDPFKEYKTFTLNDPYRLVVDIYGQEAPQKTVTNTVQPGNKTQNHITNPAVEKEHEQSSIPLLSDNKKYGPTGPNPHIKLQPEPLSLTQQLGLGIKTIVIDPGHGGKDPGAMAHGLKEKDIVLKIAKELAKILRKDFQYQVILTREKDVYIPLEQRTEIANRKKADLFVSIHVNAHSDQSNSGIETYFLNLATDADAMRVAALENASSTHSIGELEDILATLMNNSKIDESSRLARFVQNNLINGFSHRYRPKNLGVKQAPFYVLIGAEMPAILAELSFISNPREARLLKNTSHLHKLARQLARGIVAYVDHHQAAVRLY
ncbi:N-acetylmuramoyl-L-alanine amidase [Desulfobulbus rhabdoformis]|uniref:N-acetylmuramoyl-L-alanine amidase n=1 Tax=Desulfobulbus rhabdoformis TaxID=34032 RepID=UPI001965B7EB|nr:N-acetylmuramoyl-L-alanine amidase [Desulfobulbus rhabdoformis]MBM9613411.1 N-acetylmuramoyl-L-alanine amidase [Desulfobulbus rhabdoformis]